MLERSYLKPFTDRLHSIALFPMEDITVCNVKQWTNPFDSIDLGAKISTVSIVVVILVFGTVAHCLIIVLERYSGDPKKRGLVNQAGYLIVYCLTTDLTSAFPANRSVFLAHHCFILVAYTSGCSLESTCRSHQQKGKMLIVGD